MGVNRNLVGRLNESVFSSGSVMGPALTNLILYGPVNRKLVSDRNLDILKKNTGSFEKIYNDHIFPEVGKMFNIMVYGEYPAPEDREELTCLFKYESPEKLRDRFRISYAGQFELDDVTRDGLFGDGKFYRHGKHIKHCFSEESGHILSARYKDLNEIAAKYVTNFSKLDEADQKDFLSFVVDVAEYDPTSWKSYGKYSREYGKEHMEMLLGDFFGVNIIDMNQVRADINMGRLIAMGNSIRFGNLSSVNERFKDHRWRREKGRPGGLHHTFVVDKHPNFPIEVMFRSNMDEVFNLYGPHRHDVYSGNGKKSNGDYLNKK